MSTSPQGSWCAYHRAAPGRLHRQRFTDCDVRSAFSARENSKRLARPLPEGSQSSPGRRPREAPPPSWWPFLAVSRNAPVKSRGARVSETTKVAPDRSPSPSIFRGPSSDHHDILSETIESSPCVALRVLPHARTAPHRAAKELLFGFADVPPKPSGGALAHISRQFPQRVREVIACSCEPPRLAGRTPPARRDHAAAGVDASSACDRGPSGRQAARDGAGCALGSGSSE